MNGTGGPAARTGCVAHAALAHSVEAAEVIGTLTENAELANDQALVFHVDGNYRSKILRNLASSTSDAYYLKGYSMWNPSVTFEARRWSLTAFVDNVFNVKGINSIASLTPDVANRQRSIFISRPITAGLRFNVKFGKDAG